MKKESGGGVPPLTDPAATVSLTGIIGVARPLIRRLVFD